jgi:predicted site-specific integrase-resolvase
MKLKEYARHQGVSCRTAWRWWKAGTLPGHQMDTGTIRIEMESPAPTRVSPRVAIYARVSSAEKKRTLDSQAERLYASGAAGG